jgi:hypothetical protein
MAKGNFDQIQRLASAIIEMQEQGRKVNKSQLSLYINEKKGDGISTVTVGKYFDEAVKQVESGLSIETDATDTAFSEEVVSMDSDKALSMFEEWYDACLEHGIEPEQVVEQVGEMKLLVNEEQIKAFEKGLELMEN